MGFDHSYLHPYSLYTSLYINSGSAQSNGQEAYDRWREVFLRDVDLRVLGFVNTEVEDNLEDVLQAIVLACQQHQAVDKSRGNPIIAY